MKMMVRVFDQVDQPSLRQLRKQIPNRTHHFFLFAPHRVRDPWTNRPRIPELDQEVVNVQPRCTIIHHYEPLNGVPVLANVAVQSDRVDCDLLEILMLGCDGFECFGDPLPVKMSAPKRDIL